VSLYVSLKVSKKKNLTKGGVGWVRKIVVQGLGVADRPKAKSHVTILEFADT
jgi:hypothetical protein